MNHKSGCWTDKNQKHFNGNWSSCFQRSRGWWLRQCVVNGEKKIQTFLSFSAFVSRAGSNWFVWRSFAMLFFTRCAMCTNYHIIFLVQSMTWLIVNISTVIVSESAQKSPSSFCYSMAHLPAPYAGCKNRCWGQCGKGVPERGVCLMILRYT